MKEAIHSVKSVIVLFVLLLFYFTGNTQDNSPWRKINDEILIQKNVYFAPGCHQHSLTGGQSFSVYIKNQNNHSVFIKGQMVAKTYCGKDIVSPFKVTLKAKEVSNGGSYEDPDNNGQTGIVSPAECKGVTYTVKISKPHTKARYVRYSNRIKTVKLTHVEVVFPDSVIAVKQAEIPAIIPAPVKEQAYDSLVNQKLFFYQHVDSLEREVSSLRRANNSLSDSLTYYRFMYDQQRTYIQLMQQPPPAKGKKTKNKKTNGEATKATVLPNK